MENVENGVIYCLSECRREILQISVSKKFCDFASTSTKSLGTPVFIGIPRGGGYFLSSTYPPPFLGQKVAAGIFLACSDVFYG